MKYQAGRTQTKDVSFIRWVEKFIPQNSLSTEWDSLFKLTPNRANIKADGVEYNKGMGFPR